MLDDVLSRAMLACCLSRHGPVALDAPMNTKRQVITDVFCSVTLCTGLDMFVGMVRHVLALFPLLQCFGQNEC